MPRPAAVEVVMRLLEGMRSVKRSDRARYATMYLAQHFLPSNAAIGRRREAARRDIIDEVRRAGSGRTLQVPRRSHLSPEQFRRDFLRPGRPVIVEGAMAHWPLAESWTFDGFRQRFAGQEVKLVQREGLTHDDIAFDREYSEEINFGAFLDIVLEGGSKYMRFSPLLEQFPELLDDFDHGYFASMIGNTLGQSFQLFIGGAGTLTPFHNAITPFFFANVQGRKRWHLVPTHYTAVMNPPPNRNQYNHSDASTAFDDADHPGLECIDHIEAETRPGDLLFVPSWMWHAVENLEPTIGVRCGFMNVRGALTEAPALTFLRLTASDPTPWRWFYYSYVNPNLPGRENDLITPRWFRPGREVPGT